MQMKVKKMKKESKGLMVLVVVLIVLLIVFTGSVTWYKVSKNNKNNLFNGDKISTTTTTKRVITVSDETIKDLEKELILKDKSLGLYSDKKLSIENVNDEDFIIFNIKNYLLDNNISYSSDDYKCGSNSNDLYSYATLGEIKKDVINNYIKNKYKTNKNYIIEENDNLYDLNEATYKVHAAKDSYRIVCEAESGGSTSYYNNLIEYETNENEIILYDRAIKCVDDVASTSCYSGNDSVYYCHEDSDNCSNKNEVVAAALKQENTKSYKHVFKKINNKYVWVSSEPYEKR